MASYNVKLTVSLFIDAPDSANIENVVDELDYDFRETTGTAQITDTEIQDAVISQF